MPIRCLRAQYDLRVKQDTAWRGLQSSISLKFADKRQVGVKGPVGTLGEIGRVHYPKLSLGSALAANIETMYEDDIQSARL
jgi:hypothetical protein